MGAERRRLEAGAVAERRPYAIDFVQLRVAVFPNRRGLKDEVEQIMIDGHRAERQWYVTDGPRREQFTETVRVHVRQT